MVGPPTPQAHFRRNTSLKSGDRRVLLFGQAFRPSHQIRIQRKRQHPLAHRLARKQPLKNWRACRDSNAGPSA